MVNRRTLLRGFGASLALGGFGAVIGAASGGKPRPVGTGPPDNEERLPIYATGRMHYRYERVDDGAYRYEATFRSDDLAARYGDPQFAFEAEIVPEAAVPARVRASGRSTLVTDARRIVGTDAEHATAEAAITQQDDVGAASALPDNVPLYHYESEDDARELKDRKAPINLGWDVGIDTVQATMESGGDGGDPWTNPGVPSTGERYINDDGEVVANEAEVQRDGDEGCGWYLPDNYSSTTSGCTTTPTPRRA